MEIITLNDARERGLKRFFTGKPCPKGHISERFVDSNSCVECRQILTKKWRSRNKEHLKRYEKEYNATRDPEENSRRVREWQKTHKRQWKAQKHKRRATIRGAKGNCSASDLLRLFLKGRCFCQIILTKENRNLDHIIPLSRGGAHDIENLQYLCETCNKSKGTKTMSEFIRSQIICEGV